MFAPRCGPDRFGVPMLLRPIGKGWLANILRTGLAGSHRVRRIPMDKATA